MEIRNQSNEEQANRRFETARARFLDDPNISDRNKEIVDQYVRDARLGKTVIGRRKKSIGSHTLALYFVHLRHLVEFCSKDLDQLTQRDMERFVEALDRDVIRSKKLVPDGKDSKRRHGGVLSSQYKTNIKKTIRKFYKYLWGNNRQYPPIVEWLDTYVDEKYIQPLTEEEVIKMLDFCRDPKERALIQTLSEAGTRISEHLSITLSGIQFHRDKNDSAWRLVSFVVWESKTRKRPVYLGKARSISTLRRWLECHPAQPRIRDDGILDTRFPDIPLFPMTHDAVRGVVRGVGLRALGKRVYPHLLRHTAATHDAANGASHYHMCKKYGWSLTSDVPALYIDRAGLDAKAIAELHLGHGLT